MAARRRWRRRAFRARTTKVDRSAAYITRAIWRKNIVAAGLATLISSLVDRRV
jgi:S-adenosylmethionine synthetase